VLRRLSRLIWGTDFDPAIRPLLLAAFAGTFAGSAAFPFLGIWAVKHLGASQVQLSVGFLLGAISAIASGWLGGHLSDHLGRRRIMLGDYNWKLPSFLDRLLPRLKVEGRAAQEAAARGPSDALPEPAAG